MLKNGISSIDKLKNSKRWQFSTGYGSRTPEYTKIRGCTSPVYKMVLYSRPSIPTGSTSANSNQHRIKFHLQLVDSVDVQPEALEGQLYTPGSRKPWAYLPRMSFCET